MTELSPAAERICKAALEHFSVYGYDGSSLNTIATSVGIKKPSLYAHFHNKDDLFFSCLDVAILAEIQFMAEMFRDKKAIETPGENYASSLAKRYETAITMRFLLRTVYLPPEKIKIGIARKYMQFIERLENYFRVEMNEKTKPGAASDIIERFISVYIGIIDSILIEVVHQDFDTAMKRFNVLWITYEDALEYRGVLSKK